MYRKLVVMGHKHGDPMHYINGYYSWPLGASYSEVEQLIDGFNRAFSLLKVDATLIAVKANQVTAAV